MDKKFLKEHFLTEYHDKFVRLSGSNRKNNLNEWTFVPSTLEEDGDDENDAPNMPSMDDKGMQQGQTDNGMVGEPQDMQQGQMGIEPNQPNSNNQQGMEDSPNNQEQSIDGAPIDNIPMSGVGEDEDSMSEDEDELDVTELTDAQEKMNKKINTVGKELTNTDSTINKLMQSIEKISSIIDSNNAKIEDLNKELKRRNPTPLEKMDLRSVESSKPYNIRPNDYWDEKLKELPNYTEYDDTDPYSDKKKEYTIKSSDLNGLSDSEIADSFKDIDLDLKNIFGLS